MEAVKKIGFWPVFALVIGSQVGSGVFMLPASLAPYGMLSLVGWAIAGLGATTLALVFAGLCGRFPRTGGPHVYVQEAFGERAAFSTGWTYWVISWVSSTAVVVASVGYLTPLIGDHGTAVSLTLEVVLLLSIALLNLKGVKAAGSVEFVLTLLKILPLFLLPLGALFFFSVDHFSQEPAITALKPSQALGQVTLLTLWGFIGLETATTPAGSVNDPCRTIPRAVVLGTLCVALLYLFNSVGIMGVMPGHELAQSKAPYVAAASIIFGGSWHLIISLMAAIICIGTLNAWVLASGQVALGLAEDRLLPRFFACKNKADAPFWALVISCAGIVPLLFLTAQENMAQQMNTIIDFSVISFLFVYGICALAYLKILWVQRVRAVGPWLVGLGALLFCGWIIYETSVTTLLMAGLFTVSGIPIYFWQRRSAKRISCEAPLL